MIGRSPNGKEYGAGGGVGVAAVTGVGTEAGDEVALLTDAVSDVAEDVAAGAGGGIRM